eukprot:superscaffoldBa00000655_g6345
MMFGASGEIDCSFCTTSMLEAEVAFFFSLSVLTERSSKIINELVNVVVSLGEPCLNEGHDAAVSEVLLKTNIFLEFIHSVPQELDVPLDQRGQMKPGLYELLAALPSQLQPHVSRPEDNTFLQDMFGERSLHSLVKNIPCPPPATIPITREDHTKDLSPSCNSSQ